ncbi:MAG TPA: metallophosphoesterase [Candidatus Limnocylindrales bacterium]|nr:metallophosphoesterase [Candidatus Limnocylindrales bacterium]
MRSFIVPWPDPSLGRELGRPFRILAVSDDEDRALDQDVNRATIQPVDLVVGCGDLAPDYLAFVADALRSQVAYVRGNHDRGAAWLTGARKNLPPPIEPAGAGPDRTGGLWLVGFGWPGVERGDAQPNERSAWLQAIRAACGRAGRQRPLVVLSHVPPAGYGDMPGSNYHRGFRGYRWFLRRARPALWLHGHVHPAAADAAVVDADGTPVVNVTGATLLDLDPSATEVRPGSLASRSVTPPAARST